jgi:hypothetical protein
MNIEIAEFYNHRKMIIITRNNDNKVYNYEPYISKINKNIACAFINTG